MRVPLAVKVMLAFVAVIAAGSLPVQWTLRQNLQEASRERVAGELQQRAALVAERLYSVPAEELRRTAQSLGAAMPERLTLIALDGLVLHDNEVGAAKLENHRERPEVASALLGQAASAVRVSASTKEELVYVAVPVRGPTGMRAVLRLASPVAPLHHLADNAAALLERGIALAVSLALLLSLLAAVQIVRPLRRMRDAANAVAAGELTLHLDVHTRDEIDDVARALEAVGAQLRSRLAHAGSGEALLGQLVHAMVQGVVVLGADGRVHHVNGVARAQLGLRGPQESERMDRLLSCEAVQHAIEASASDPLGVDMRVPHPVTDELLDGTVVALRRPDGDPLYALILDVNPVMGTSMADLPHPDDVVVVPLREMMDRALSRVREDLDDSNATFTAPDEWPATQVVDAGGRVEGVVVETLRAAAQAPGAQLNSPLTASVQNGSVCVQLPVNLAPEFLKTLEPRLAPLGGRIETGTGNVRLWLPRA